MVCLGTTSAYPGVAMQQTLLITCDYESRGPAVISLLAVNLGVV